EDGIRDRNVTGVQTCALPIWAEHIGAAISSQLPLSNSMTAFEYGCGTGLLSFALKDKLGAMTLADVSDGMLGVLEKKIQQHQIRSEERRVGKEQRTWRAA